MLAGGHTRVPYLGYPPQGRWDTGREAGYQDAMKSAGLIPDVTRTALAPAETDVFIAALLHAPSRLTAVVAVAIPLATVAARLIDRVIDLVNGVPQEHGGIIGTSVTRSQSSG